MLKHYLQEAIEQDFSCTPRSSTPENVGSEHKKDKMEPFVLFGSSFRKDKEYTQVKIGAVISLHISLIIIVVLVIIICTLNTGVQKY